MLFLGHICAEHVDEFSTTRSVLQADATSRRLIFRQSSLLEGEELHTWTFSVDARDIDPSLVEVTAPDSNDIRHLSAVCSLYRSAVSGTWLKPGHPPTESHGVRLLLPLSNSVQSGDEVVKSFREFLTICGAKTPTVFTSEIEDLLAIIRPAVSLASGVRVPSNDKKVFYDQSARLDELKLVLVRESCRPGFSPDRWTFDLLSLDITGISCMQVPSVSELWEVTLPSVERLETTAWQIRLGSATRWWYTSFLFSSQSGAQLFANACAECVPKLRERLYRVNYVV
jgi:hypothetical protein